MSKSLRTESHAPRQRPTRSAQAAGFYGALREEFALAWIWASSVFRNLLERVIRDGIPPSRTFQGLPSGQFPPIEAIKDELFGRTGRERATAAPFEGNVVSGVRLPSLSGRGPS